MNWHTLGFCSDPFNTDSIAQDTLPLYVGHDDKVRFGHDLLMDKNINLVVEGVRGVGTTSFANLLRFNAQKAGRYFTPDNEIRVEAGWNLEMLFAAVISAVVRTLESAFYKKVKKHKSFLAAKSISNCMAEIYRNMGVQLGAYGFTAGFSYNATPGTSAQPMIVPSNVLGDHLEDLATLVKTLGFQHGLLIQLNNLDVGSIHEANQLKRLFHALRDYMQTNGISWILVGDVGLRSFIAQEVDRLHEIINYEFFLDPLQKLDGIEQRIAKSIKSHTLEIAENCLRDGMQPDHIARLTGLTAVDIKKLSTEVI